MYEKNSPQGKMIENAQKRAAASAAQSNSFTADSSALNTTDISPVLNTIADDVEIIRNSVNQLVVIAEADARGDALGAANVTDGDIVPTMTGDGQMAGGGSGGGDGSVAGDLAGMGGMAGFIGGLGKGLSMWAGAGPGVLVFTGFLALMTLVVYGSSHVGYPFDKQCIGGAVTAARWRCTAGRAAFACDCCRCASNGGTTG